MTHAARRCDFCGKAVNWICQMCDVGDDLKIISKIAPHLGVLFLAFLFRLHFNLPVMIKIDVFFSLRLYLPSVV